MAHGLSCSVACGIFPEQGSNLCLLHRQADSLLLSHQGSPGHSLGVGWRVVEGPLERGRLICIREVLPWVLGANQELEIR